MSTLVECASRLRDIGSSRDTFSSDFADDLEKIAGHLEALSARLTPPAEVVRYDLTAQHSEVSGYTTYRVETAADGEWVRYEDHAAAVLALRLELYGANCKVDEAAEALARVKTSGRALISIGAEAAVEAADSAEGWKERAEKAEAALAAARAVPAEVVLETTAEERADHGTVAQWLMTGQLFASPDNARDFGGMAYALLADHNTLAAALAAAETTRAAAQDSAAYWAGRWGQETIKLEADLAASEAKRKEAEERTERAVQALLGFTPGHEAGAMVHAICILRPDPALDQPKTEDAA